MNKSSIDIDIVKQFVDHDTLVKMATLEAEKRANNFKFLLNIINDKRYPNKKYGQLKGTFGYDGTTKLWVTHYIGKIADSTTIDKSAICSQYSTLIKTKAKDVILKELLK
jgi:hypothetical protein